MKEKGNALMKKNWFVLTAAAAAVFALLSAGCGTKANDQREAPRELRYGFTSEPATLDPLNSSNTADGRSILFNVFEGLIKTDASGKMQPCVAESWTVEQDGKSYLFKLREGVLFHDETPLSVDDVKFTFEQASESGFTGFTQIQSVADAGDNQVRITLVNPDPEFLPYITIGIVKNGSTRQERERGAIGTGPYEIESYTTQQELVLKKFDKYWRADDVQLDKVTIVFLADSDAMMLALQGNNIDGASITAERIAQVDAKRFDLFPGYSAAVQLLALNNNMKPFDDARVRKALNLAISRQSVIDGAFFGKGETSGGPIIPGLNAYYEESVRNPPFDENQAKELLKQAGFTDAKPLSFEITVPSNYTMHVDTAQVIADQLGKAGIKVSIQQVDWATWLADVYRGRKYQSTIISLDALNVSPRSFLARYRSDASSNFVNFVSSAFDSAYDSALTESNEQKRIDFYKKCQRIIVDESASVYLQDIMSFKVFRAGAYDGALSYPLYVVDFSTMYGKGAGGK